jgi:hypothetical protein
MSSTRHLFVLQSLNNLLVAFVSGGTYGSLAACVPNFKPKLMQPTAT